MVSASTDGTVTSDTHTDNESSVYSISNLTISWPNDGWYQLQRQTNYETVCEGGTQCSVTPGVYTLINLTTGERFENIRVEDQQENEDFRLDGNNLTFFNR